MRLIGAWTHVRFIVIRNSKPGCSFSVNKDELLSILNNLSLNLDVRVVHIFQPPADAAFMPYPPVAPHTSAERSFPLRPSEGVVLWRRYARGAGVATP